MISSNIVNYMLIDPELLRTLVAFVDAGSLARAADIVGRTPSAITAQMRRLEDIVGERLLLPSGRGRVLTPAGGELVVHARRILEAHRDAWLSLAGTKADGRLAVAATQDFADSVLPDLLQMFSRTHSRVRLELRIGRTADLAGAFEAGACDILLAMRGAQNPHEIGVLCEPMIWIGSRQGLTSPDGELPLAFLDPPCGFRCSALAALDAERRPYRIAATSGSLSGLRAALRGSLAITVRTARWLGDDLALADTALGLPKLNDAEFSLRLRPDATKPARDFAELLRTSLDMVPSKS